MSAGALPCLVQRLQSQPHVPWPWQHHPLSPLHLCVSPPLRRTPSLVLGATLNPAPTFLKIPTSSICEDCIFKQGHVPRFKMDMGFGGTLFSPLHRVQAAKEQELSIFEVFSNCLLLVPKRLLPQQFPQRALLTATIVHGQASQAGTAGSVPGFFSPFPCPPLHGPSSLAPPNPYDLREIPLVKLLPKTLW